MARFVRVASLGITVMLRVKPLGKVRRVAPTPVHATISACNRVWNYLRCNGARPPLAMRLGAPTRDSGPGVLQPTAVNAVGSRERIFIELMTSGRKLKASREGLK